MDDMTHCRRRWGYDITMRQMYCVPFNDWTGNGRHVKLAPAYVIMRRTLRLLQLPQTSRCTYLPFPSMTNLFWFRCRTLLLFLFKQPDTDFVWRVDWILSVCVTWSRMTAVCVCWTYHTSCDRNSIECVVIRSFRFLSCYFPHSFMHWFLSCGTTMLCICALYFDVLVNKIPTASAALLLLHDTKVHCIDWGV